MPKSTLHIRNLIISKDMLEANISNSQDTLKAASALELELSERGRAVVWRSEGAQ